MIRSISYPRAALFGNPSDGFYGKTIAFPFADFQAEVILTPIDSGIKLQGDDQTYPDFNQFYQSVKRKKSAEKSLLQATLRRFLDYCKKQNISFPKAGFEITFQSSIPLQVGMAGSSAIITAAWRVLMQHFGIQLAPHLLANQVLETETQEMGIGAGLQDRVVQAYECPVYMDFGKELMDNRGFGDYQPMSEKYFQHLYIAYMEGAPEGSEIIHNDLRSRFDHGELAVHQVMKELSDLTVFAKQTLEKPEDRMNLAALIDQNFDLRKSICQIAPAHLKMIEVARNLGASAKFTGSGGTIIGQYTSEAMYQHLEEEFAHHNIQLFKPSIVSNP